MIDRRIFLSSLATSVLLSRRSQARIVNGGSGNTPSVDPESRFAGPRPVPTRVKGVGHGVIDLNGAWQFSAGSSASFRRHDLDKLSWTPVQMPNELEMESVSAGADVEYLLHRTIEIPLDFAGKAVVVRFDGVYSYARVWINGHYVREHHGGFTSWDCEISQYVNAGESADLVVVLVDRSDDPSGASEYAKHSIAGILRDVRLLALPQLHIEHLHISASLDDHYVTGLLDVQTRLNNAASVAASIDLSLRDPKGVDVAMRFAKPIRSGSLLKFEQIRVPDIQRWDSEHPNLYELTIELRVGDELETLTRPIGFRRIERLGNQLLVNGERVVLHGVCRHDIHPTRGRAPSLQNDERDPTLLRKAHINFVRTSHYPPTEAFLTACDRAGIYVEEETAVCFSTTAASDPVFNDRFVSQFGEMLERDHWHPSVILWSLGNESAWGANFVSELKRVREADPGRPVIFSWSDTLGADRPLLDVYSSHYPVWDSDLGSNDFPVLHDEFAHIACYNTDDLRRDPGVRNFWGRSIAIFGKKFFETAGCLGGAIWAGLDEVFLLPDRVTGNGPWGILDGWRREKPEFWLTRKAFSPIRLDDGVLPMPQSGEPPVITVGNGYNHTNLKELKIEWAVGHQQGVIPGPDVPPHGVSQFRVPVTGFRKGETLKLSFQSPDGAEVDRFELPLGERVIPTFPSPSGKLRLRNTPERITISGRKFSLAIDRKTGLISGCTTNDRSVIVGGPYLTLGQDRPSAWSLASLDVREIDRSITVAVSGESKVRLYAPPGEGVLAANDSVQRETSEIEIGVQFDLEVFGDGCIELRYRLAGKLEVKIDQLGMVLVLPASVDRLMWHRQALWSVYPDDHIGRPSGTAYRISPRSSWTSRVAPDWPWSEDMHEPFLNGYQLPAGAATNDFRSLKENVFWAGCFQGEAPEHLRVESQGDVAVRASVHSSGKIDLNIYNFWRHPNLGAGNYEGPNQFRVHMGVRPRLPRDQKISLRIADNIAGAASSFAL
jgi:hypothetical protein